MVWVCSVRPGLGGRAGIARCGQIAQQRLGRGKGIEPDRMGHLMGAAGIGRQDQRDFPVSRGGRRQTVPGGHTVHHGGNAVRIGAVGKARKLQVGVARARGI